MEVERRTLEVKHQVIERCWDGGELMNTNDPGFGVYIPFETAARLSIVVEPWNGIARAVSTATSNRVNVKRIVKVREILRRKCCLKDMFYISREKLSTPEQT